MTTQPIEAPAIDIELIVGEMPEVPCEHPKHASNFAHSGPASHYVTGRCGSCGGNWATTAICQRFVDFLTRNAKVRCSICGYTAPASEIVRILGPVK